MNLQRFRRKVQRYRVLDKRETKRTVTVKLTRWGSEMLRCAHRQRGVILRN